MEKALHLWMEDEQKMRSDWCWHVAPEIIKLIWTYQQGICKTSGTTPFIEINGWLRKFKDMFGLKNIKIIWKAAFADKLLLPHFLQC